MANCTVRLLPRRPRDALARGDEEGLNEEGLNQEKEAAAQVGEGEEETERSGGKNSFCVELRSTWRAARRCRARPGALLPYLLHGFQLGKTEEYGTVLDLLYSKSKAAAPMAAAAAARLPARAVVAGRGAATRRTPLRLCLTRARARAGRRSVAAKSKEEDGELRM